MRSFHRKLVGRRRISFFLSFFRLLIRMNTRTREAPPPARGSKNEGKRQKSRQFSASSRSYFPRSLALSLSRVLAAVRRWSLNCNCFDFVFCFFPVLFASFLSFHWRLAQTFLSFLFIGDYIWSYMQTKPHRERTNSLFIFDFGIYLAFKRKRTTDPKKNNTFGIF